MDTMGNTYTIGNNDYSNTIYTKQSDGDPAPNINMISPVNNYNIFESFPAQTPCSKIYNNYEIEIFADFDDQPKCFLFWLVILFFIIAFFPIFLIAFILQNTTCPRYMISRVYIYKKGNTIAIKRKGNNSCYCLYCASHSYFDVNNINRFDTDYHNGVYLFKLIDNNGQEDFILPISGISKEVRDKNINFLNSLITLPYAK